MSNCGLGSQYAHCSMGGLNGCKPEAMAPIGYTTFTLLNELVRVFRAVSKCLKCYRLES